MQNENKNYLFTNLLLESEDDLVELAKLLGVAEGQVGRQVVEALDEGHV